MSLQNPKITFEKREIYHLLLGFLEKLSFSIALPLSLWRFLLGGPIYPVPDVFEKLILDMVLWVFIVVVFLLLLGRDKIHQGYLLLRGNLPIFIFVTLAIFSLLWSVNPFVTFYKVFVLISVTMVSIYVGLTHNTGEFLNKLAWFWGVVALASLYLGLAYPEAGRFIGYPYFGAWRGIFWSRGGLGSFIVFANLVFLLQVSRFWKKKYVLSINLLFYFLTAALLFFSRSATAIITMIVLHGAFISLVLWAKYREKLKRSHYLFLGATGLALGIGILSNLDFLFGLLGRNASLTGRIPLWVYLFDNVFMQKPILGYGFSTIWEHNNFRLYMQEIIGWEFPVMIGDNAFLDILLGLGIVGGLSFVIVYLLAIVRGWKYAFLGNESSQFFPLLSLLYIFVINISLSRMFELEFFGWFLLCSTLFITTSKRLYEN